MVKRRLVLHLGLWKTGTKTIQSFLRRNPDMLAEMGIHYPKVGPENPGHPFFLPTRFYTDEISHLSLGQELNARMGRMSGDLPLWSTAFRLFENSGARTAIISYEDFSARPAFYDFHSIAERLRTFDVVGIIYLRPQESWMVSYYSHEVRRAATALSFRDFVEKTRDRLIYSALLDQILTRFPLDKLVVRDFDRAIETDLIGDFLQSLELPSPAARSTLEDSVENKSLPHWAVLFLLECARTSFSSEQLSELRKVLTWFANRKRGPSIRPGLDLATPEERAALRAMMEADAERLWDRYGLRFADPKPAATIYRPFEREDFNIIKEAIAPRLPERTRAAVEAL